MQTACDWTTSIDVGGKCKQCDPCTKSVLGKTCVKDVKYDSCIAALCNWGTDIVKDGKCVPC